MTWSYEERHLLADLTSLQVDDVILDITFITEYVEVQSQMPRKDTSEGDEDFYETIMAEMEDAMSTSYIHGRWVTTSMTDGYVNEILKNKLYAHICTGKFQI